MFSAHVTEENGCVKRKLAQVSDSFGIKLGGLKSINKILEFILYLVIVFISEFELQRLKLNGQYHQDVVLVENPMKVLVLIGTPIIVAWRC